MTSINNNNTNTKKIFIGLDSHTTNYNVCFYDSENHTFNYESKLKADDGELVKFIKRMIKRHYSDGEYEFLLGYEAGYTGYETARYLEEHKINCVIMAPNTIKRSPKQKSYKNDSADARLIAQTLSNNDYSAVLIPTPEEESFSHLLRIRDSVRKEITKTKNQITSLLVQAGFKSKAGKWSKDYKKEVAEFVDHNCLELDAFVLSDLLSELTKQELRLETYEAKIVEATEKDEEIKQKVKEISALKGIDIITAANLISVAKDITRFEKPGQFVNYLGLAPGEKSSGKKQNTTGITKNGNPRIRSLLILAAQTYCRGSANYKSDGFLKGLKDLSPELTAYIVKAYERLHKKFYRLKNIQCKPHNVCVAAIARELACFVWGILSGNIQ